MSKNYPIARQIRYLLEFDEIVRDDKLVLPKLWSFTEKIGKTKIIKTLFLPRIIFFIICLCCNCIIFVNNVTLYPL